MIDNTKIQNVGNFVFAIHLEMKDLFIFLLGTSIFACVKCKTHPLLLISFDGLQSDRFEAFLKQNPDCAFNAIIRSGVKAEYMIPSFPTLTIPNHWSLITGKFLTVDLIIFS